MPTELPDLEDLLDHTADAVLAVDDELTVTYANATAREYAGVDDLVGRSLADAFPGLTATRVDAGIRNAIETGEPTTVEDFVSGTGCWLAVRAFPAETGLFIYAMDVTERREATASLEREHHLLDRLFETSPVGIVVVDPGGDIVQANERAEELLGVDRPTITSRAYDAPEWEDVDAEGEPIPGEDLPVGRVLATGKPVFGYEHGIRHPDGTERWLSVNAAPLRSVDGVRAVATFEDVTDRNEFERRVTEANERLALLNRLLRHDVRNDLQVILGWADVLRDNVDPAASEYVARIENAASEAVELTETARDLTDLVLGTERSDLRDVPLHGVLADELAKHEELYPRAEFRAGDLPAVTVRADPLLGSLFGNVLSNAVQHSDRDHPTVTLSVEAGPETVTVRVADDGPGISEEVRETLFESPGPEYDTTGSGIGLFLVQQLVRHYGGEVTAEPNEPRGTVFSVTLCRAGGSV